MGVEILKRGQIINNTEEYHKFLESLLDSIDDGIAVLDRDFRILYINKPFFDIYDVCSDRNDKNAKKAYQNNLNACRELMLKLIGRFIYNVSVSKKKSISLVREFSGRKKRKYVRIRIYPFKNDLIIVVSEDITENVLLRKKISEYHRKLRIAYNELKTLDFLKSAIISNVSHELKTPITVIKGIIDDLFANIRENGEIKTMIIKAKKNIQRLLDIIEDLIIIARIVKGDYKPNKSEFYIKDVIDEVLRKKIEFAKSKNVEIITDIQNVKIFADKTLIRNVISNLVDNAIKFNKKNGKVFIRVYRENSWVVIEIEDTGIGIPKEKLEKIFEPFYQVDPTIRRKYGGTGLGLAIVKRAVDIHKGMIEVKSWINKGTIFKIKIPNK